MILEQAVLEVLKKYSSKEKTYDTKPLSCAEIVEHINNDFAKEIEESARKKISYKRVRAILKRIVDSEDKSETKSIYCSVSERAGEDYKTGYWTSRSISDVELKFLIDSVMYSKIFNSRKAQDLAKRIQDLSGKNLYNMTSYANSTFGKQRLLTNIDVLDNIKKLMYAEKKNAFVSFVFCNYDVEGKQVVLKEKHKRIVKPLYIILDEGRYFLLARHQNSEKIYTYSIDLMSKLVIDTNLQDKVDDEDLKNNLNFIRAEYPLAHPYNMGGDIGHFRLRVSRKFFSRVVDAFSYRIEIVADNPKADTVDIKVDASEEGMKKWLLANYDIVEVLNPSKRMQEFLLGVGNELIKKYNKNF